MAGHHSGSSRNGEKSGDYSTDEDAARNRQKKRAIPHKSKQMIEIKGP